MMVKYASGDFLKIIYATETCKDSLNGKIMAKYASG